MQKNTKNLFPFSVTVGIDFGQSTVTLNVKAESEDDARKAAEQQVNDVLATGEQDSLLIIDRPQYQEPACDVVNIKKIDASKFDEMAGKQKQVKPFSVLPYGIVVHTYGNEGAIQSMLEEQFADDEDSEKETEAKELAAYVVESLLLALSCEGVNVNTPQFASAIKTAAESIVNYMD